MRHLTTKYKACIYVGFNAFMKKFYIESMIFIIVFKWGEVQAHSTSFQTDPRTMNSRQLCWDVVWLCELDYNSSHCLAGTPALAATTSQLTLATLSREHWNTKENIRWTLMVDIVSANRRERVWHKSGLAVNKESSGLLEEKLTLWWTVCNHLISTSGGKWPVCVRNGRVEGGGRQCRHHLHHRPVSRRSPGLKYLSAKPFNFL